MRYETELVALTCPFTVPALFPIRRFEEMSIARVAHRYRDQPHECVPARARRTLARVMPAWSSEQMIIVDGGRNSPLASVGRPNEGVTQNAHTVWRANCERRRNVPSADLGPGYREYFTKDKANAVLDKGNAYPVAFGVPFPINPDLPERLRREAPYNKPNPALFYGVGTEGYTDHPALTA